MWGKGFSVSVSFAELTRNSPLASKVEWLLHNMIYVKTYTILKVPRESWLCWTWVPWTFWKT